MSDCPFCKSADTRVLTAAGYQDTRYWRYCNNCGASGPHKDSEEAATAAFSIDKPAATNSLAFIPTWLRGKRNER